MVMELLEGDTLKAHLNAYRTRKAQFPFGDMLRIMNDVLSGLAYAHGEGIIHRDLKPANIMLTKSGQAVLTDFGIAQIVGGTQYTVSGALMGTLNYMAPEQGLDGKCDIRSDIYSLGIAYYEILTGSVPFDADTPLAILMKHINDPLPMPHNLNPSIPEPFERVALKALSKHPDDRFQSAAEMAGALEAAGRETGIEPPVKLKLPQVESGSQARDAVVPVFSGTARQHITDAGFASGDTDITFGKKTKPGASKGLLNTTKNFFTPPQKLGPVEPAYVTRSVLYSVTGIALINMTLLWLSGIFGWQVFGRTWPMELVAVGVLLSALMAAYANFWFIIPAGLVLGNGFLFSYFALTGSWQDWTFLWPMEPMMVALSIIAPFLLQRLKLRGRWLARRIGVTLIILSVMVFLLSILIAVILPK
jgi:hypothetical protein